MFSHAVVSNYADRALVLLQPLQDGGERDLISHVNRINVRKEEVGNEKLLLPLLFNLMGVSFVKKKKKNIMMISWRKIMLSSPASCGLLSPNSGFKHGNLIKYTRLFYLKKNKKQGLWDLGPLISKHILTIYPIFIRISPKMSLKNLITATIQNTANTGKTNNYVYFEN